MIVKAFVIAKNQNESSNIMKHILKPIDDNITNIEVLKNEQYWKFKEQFEITYKIKMENNFDKEKEEKFLNSISDKWTKFSSPTKEAIASVTTEGCNYMMDNVYMINIIYQDLD